MAGRVGGVAAPSQGPSPAYGGGCKLAKKLSSPKTSATKIARIGPTMAFSSAADTYL